MKRRQAKGLEIAVLAAAALFMACGSAWAEPSCTLDKATGTVIDKEPFLRNAYGARWNIATNRIVFMQPNAKGYYQLFTISPQGGNPQAITGIQPELPADKHHGAPFWHPSGRYILFVGQKQDWGNGKTMFGSPDYGALPGFGVHDDLWLIAVDGSRSWKLTNEPNTKQQGELLPVFSPDGKHIAWTSRQPDKTYVVKLADFVEKPEPHLSNIQSYLPGGAAYYEPGSFTSDSKSLIFTSDYATHSFWRSQIFRLDFADGKSTRLTTGNYYNEHPVVVSTPEGDWIVYMSTRGVDRRPWHLMLGTDWYAMRTDGSETKRLTTMNLKLRDNPEDEGEPLVGCTVAMGPSGDFMLGDVQDSLVRQTGMIKGIHLTCR